MFEVKKKIEFQDTALEAAKKYQIFKNLKKKWITKIFLYIIFTAGKTVLPFLTVINFLLTEGLYISAILIAYSCCLLEIHLLILISFLFVNYFSNIPI